MSSGPHFLLSAKATFSAAHTLPGAGVCERMHGHNWTVRITVRVPEPGLDVQGMGVDFHAIEEIVENAVSEFDHVYLNDLDPFKQSPPTAESIAREVYRRSLPLLENVSRTAALAEVEVWEMDGYRAAYRPE